MASNRCDLGWSVVQHAAELLAKRHEHDDEIQGVYGVPTGGSVLAVMVAMYLDVSLIEDPAGWQDSVLVVDDLVDSGHTLTPYLHQGFRVDAAFRKTHSPATLAPYAKTVDGWVTFPWEHRQATDGKDAVVRLLEVLGQDPNRDGLRDTPSRVVRALQELTSGYADDAATHLARVFEAEDWDEVVVLKGIRFTSLCEHHLLPFTGTAAVAYLPQERRVVGLSKLARVVQVFARRLQLQERLTSEIAGAVLQHLQARGVAVVVEAAHACMGCRGVNQPEARMVTSSMLGVFRHDAAARAEVLHLMGVA